MPHEVEALDDGQFKVRVFGDHDWDALDTLM